jgi:hypothetical protein
MGVVEFVYRYSTLPVPVCYNISLCASKYISLLFNNYFCPRRFSLISSMLVTSEAHSHQVSIGQTSQARSLPKIFGDFFEWIIFIFMNKDLYSLRLYQSYFYIPPSSICRLHVMAHSQYLPTHLRCPSAICKVRTL